ncbi:hypothetical protein ACTFIV_002911 [Dictyostelium citrinum]
MEELRKKQPARNPLRSGHPHNMYDMITETPNALKRVLEEEIVNIKSIANILKDKKKIYLIGIGTSYHAALNAKYFLKSLGKVDCEAINSMEFILNPPLFNQDTNSYAMIIFSHSGIKTYSYQAYLKGKELNVYSVLVTSLNSVIEHPIDAIIRTSLQEQSAAFTISHSCSTLCSLLLSVEIGRLNGLVNTTIDNELLMLPSLFSGILEKSIPEIKEWCKAAVKFENRYFMGYGGNESNAYEVSLKIQEATYTFCQGYNLEFYLHGPFIATNEKTLSTFIITSTTHQLDSAKHKEIIDRTLKSVNLVQNVNSNAALILSESDTTSASQIGKDTILIRAPDVSEPISVLTNLYILQLMTYFMAVEANTNPDSFKRNIPPFDTCFPKSGLIL